MVIENIKSIRDNEYDYTKLYLSNWTILDAFNKSLLCYKQGIKLKFQNFYIENWSLTVINLLCKV